MSVHYLKDFEEKYLNLTILFFFPILQVWINSNWIFNPIKALPLLAFRDTWFYNGIFFYFFDYVNEGFMSDHYFIERLPSNIPGYYLYHLLSPLKANYILHLGYYYIAVFSIYFILYSLLNKRTALIASLAMGSYPWFLRAVGWDYVDGIGIAYYCLSMGLLVGAMKRPRPGLLLYGAGISTACLIFTNLFWLPFTVMLMAFYILIRYAVQKRRVIIDMLSFCAGGLTITVFFSLFFYSVSGRYVFFENSIRAAFTISKDSGLTSLLERMYATMEPYWLILPTLLLCSAGILLVTRQLSVNSHSHAVPMILLLQFSLTFGFLVFWHIFFQPYLFIFLYMSYLIPSTFLLFGALISSTMEDLTNQQYYIVVVLCLIVFVAPLALTSFYFETLTQIQDNLILLTISGLMLVASLLLRSHFSIILSCTAIVMIGFIGGADANVYVRDRWQGKNSFISVVKAVKVIDEINPNNRPNLALLYDDSKFDVPGGALQGIYANISGLGYEQNRPIGWEIITPFNDHDVILIAHTNKAYQNIEEYFSHYPDTVQLDLQSRVRIQSGNFEFYLFLLHISYQEHDHLYSGEIFEFDRPFEGKNFYPFENMQDQSFVWSGPEKETEMYFNLGRLNNDAGLDICVYALQPEILDNLQLYVNDVYVPVRRSRGGGCSSLFTAIIPQAIIGENASDVTKFVFQVSKTVSPLELGINADSRQLALRFDWIKIR